MARNDVLMKIKNLKSNFEKKWAKAERENCQIAFKMRTRLNHANSNVAALKRLQSTHMKHWDSMDKMRKQFRQKIKKMETSLKIREVAGPPKQQDEDAELTAENRQPLDNGLIWNPYMKNGYITDRMGNHFRFRATFPKQGFVQYKCKGIDCTAIAQATGLKPNRKSELILKTEHTAQRLPDGKCIFEN